VYKRDEACLWRASIATHQLWFPQAPFTEVLHRPTSERYLVVRRSTNSSSSDCAFTLSAANRRWTRGMLKTRSLAPRCHTGY
jgi:hypothetical protein